MKILHIIESLDVGGAEVIFTESLRCLPAHYSHVVVYMRKPDTLLESVNASAVYCLGVEDKISFQYAIFKLRKIIKANHVELIHSHLYWPTILARLSKPQKVPLVFTVHGCLGMSLFSKSLLHRYLEKITYKKEQYPTFVSKTVSEDYSNYMNVKGEKTVLYNFAANKFYSPKYKKAAGTFSKNSLRLVAVGNLKAVKNYDYIIKVFLLLKSEEIYLDIIGDGPLVSEIRASIENKGLSKVKLRGTSDKVFELLRNYDAFILASTSEGLSLAVIEAMAVGLPCILSNIASNKEVAGDAALFFNLNNPQDCANKLLYLLKNKSVVSEMAEASRAKAEDFRIDNYIQKLDSFYRAILCK